MTDESEGLMAAVELAKRQLVDVLWKTANIEVDGITFPDTQEIFDGRAPENMNVDDIITVNNIKRAWMFLFDSVEHPIDWPYVSEYNRILGEGLVRDAGALRTHDVRIGGTDWIPDIPTVESSHGMVAESSALASPEERAISVFCAITRGQWFNDGNKRTALMAANHALINAGVGVFAISPSLKREFTAKLLRYYETGDRKELGAWLKDNAIGHLPGGLTIAEQCRLHERTAAGPVSLPLPSAMADPSSPLAWTGPERSDPSLR